MSTKPPLTPGPGGDTPRARTLARPARRAGLPRPAPAPAPETPERPVVPVVAQALVNRGLGATRRLALLVALLVVLFLAYLPSLVVFFDQQRQTVAAQQQIAAQQAQIDAMRDEITRWQDPAYVKAQARDRLGWVVPGETGYVVIGPDGHPVGGGAVIARPDPSSGLTSGPWYAQVWGSIRAADDPRPT